jgi:hypothetical protein
MTDFNIDYSKNIPAQIDFKVKRLKRTGMDEGMARRIIENSVIGGLQRANVDSETISSVLQEDKIITDSDIYISHSPEEAYWKRFFTKHHWVGEKFNILDHMAAGWGDSDFNHIWEYLLGDPMFQNWSVKKSREFNDDTGMFERWAKMGTTIVADLPFFWGFGKIAKEGVKQVAKRIPRVKKYAESGGHIAGFGGAGFLNHKLKDMYHEAILRGDVKNGEEWWEIFMETGFKEATKSGLILASMGAGGVLATTAKLRGIPYATNQHLNQMVALTGTPIVFDGMVDGNWQWPTEDMLEDNVALIGAFGSVGYMANKASLSRMSKKMMEYGELLQELMDNPGAHARLKSINFGRYEDMPRTETQFIWTPSRMLDRLALAVLSNKTLKQMVDSINEKSTTSYVKNEKDWFILEEWSGRQRGQWKRMTKKEQKELTKDIKENNTPLILKYKEQKIDIHTTRGLNGEFVLESIKIPYGRKNDKKYIKEKMFEILGDLKLEADRLDSSAVINVRPDIFKNAREKKGFTKLLEELGFKSNKGKEVDKNYSENHFIFRPSTKEGTIKGVEEVNIQAKRNMELEPSPTPHGGKPNTRAEIQNLRFNRLKWALINDKEPIIKFEEAVRRSARKEGIKDLIKQNELLPHQYLELMAGVAGKALHWLKYGTYDLKNPSRITGESLYDILESLQKDINGKEIRKRKDIQKNVNDFEAYIIYKRMMEKYKQGLITEEFFNKGERATAKRIIKELGPRFKDTHKRLLDYQGRLLSQLRDSGIISQDMYVRMREANKDYVPFSRLMEQGNGFIEDPLRLIKHIWEHEATRKLFRQEAKERALDKELKRPFITKTQKERLRTEKTLMDSFQPLGGFQPVFNPLKQFKGQTRLSIESPIDVIYKNTQTFIALAERNMAYTKFVEFVEKAGDIPAHYGVKKVPAKAHPVTVDKQIIRKQLENILEKKDMKKLSDKDIENFHFFTRGFTALKPTEIAIFRNGKREVWEVGEAIAISLKNHVNKTHGWLLALGTAPARWLRLGATTVPEFVIKNMVRDSVWAAVFSENSMFQGNLPVLNTLKGFKAVTKGNKLYQEWLRSGAAQSAMLSFETNYFDKDIAKTLMRRKLPNQLDLKKPFHSVRLLSELGEHMTRVGDYKMSTERLRAINEKRRKANKPALTEKELLDKAGHESRNITLDFAKQGLKVAAAKQLIAFWNPSLQGKVKIWEQFTPKMMGGKGAKVAGRSAMRAALFLTAPSIWLWMAQHDDPVYKKIPEWQKILFWNIVIGEGEDAIVFKIPKPFELGTIFATMPEYMMEWMYANTPEDKRKVRFSEVMGEILENEVKSLVQWPTIMQGPLEGWMNKNFHMDIPILSEAQKKLSPEYIQYPYTSEISKLISRELFLWNPIKTGPGSEGAIPAPKIDNLIRAYFGTWGQYARNVTDWLITNEATKDKEGLTFVERVFISQKGRSRYKNYDGVIRHYLRTDNVKGPDKVGLMRHLTKRNLVLKEYIKPFSKKGIENFRFSELSEERQEALRRTGITPEIMAGIDNWGKIKDSVQYSYKWMRDSFHYLANEASYMPFFKAFFTRVPTARKEINLFYANYEKYLGGDIDNINNMPMHEKGMEWLQDLVGEELNMEMLHLEGFRHVISSLQSQITMILYEDELPHLKHQEIDVKLQELYDIASEANQEVHYVLDYMSDDEKEKTRNGRSEKGIKGFTPNHGRTFYDSEGTIIGYKYPEWGQKGVQSFEDETKSSEEQRKNFEVQLLRHHRDYVQSKKGQR